MNAAGTSSGRPQGAARKWIPIVALAVIALVGLWVGAVVVGYPNSCDGQAVDGACPKPTADITSPVDGVVIGVDASGLGNVRGFTLRPTGNPFAFDFVIGQLEDPTAFAPGHLSEHQATSTPVRVWFRVENGQRVVYRLEDAAG